MGQINLRIFYYVIWKNGLVGILLPTNMAAAIWIHRDFLNFEKPQLLHLLVYRPETCRELSKRLYLRYVKILLKKSLILIFDDVVANQE